MFAIFDEKKGLIVLSLNLKKKNMFCSYFFQIEAQAVLYFGGSEARCSHRVVLIRRKKFKRVLYKHGQCNDIWWYESLSICTKFRKKKEENKQKHCPSPDSNPEPQAKGKRISALPHL